MIRDELQSPVGSSVGAEVIESIDRPGDQRWEAAIESHSDASFFHGSAWARVLRDTYAFSPCYFIHEQNGQRCSLPIMEVNSWLTGRRGTSLPFTDECAPLCSHPESFAQVFREAVNYGRSRQWRTLELRGGRQWFKGAVPSVSFFGHRLEFPADVDALFSQTDSAVRRAVRKAEQSGLTVEFSRSEESVRTFYRLMLKTRQRHGVPPQPFAFFESIHRHVIATGQGWVVLARQGEVAVAGAVFFHAGRTAIYKFGASDEAYQQLRGNNLVMWRAIDWYARNGFRGIDFGRTSLGNDGLRRFKLSWGATERTIDYFKYDLRTNAFVAGRDQSSGWYSRVFRRLPGRVAQWIGSTLYKHVD